MYFVTPSKVSLNDLVHERGGECTRTLGSYLKKLARGTLPPSKRTSSLPQWAETLKIKLSTKTFKNFNFSKKIKVTFRARK